jgi:hypothetical protein
MEAALLAGEFELGGELGTAVDLQRADGKRHAVLQVSRNARKKNELGAESAVGKESSYERSSSRGET